REVRPRLHAGMRGQAAHAGAVRTGNPEIVRVGESNQGAVRGRLGYEAGVVEVDGPGSPGGGAHQNGARGPQVAERKSPDRLHEVSWGRALRSRGRMPHRG